MERLPAGVWGVGGVGIAGALLGATVVLSPAGDLWAVVGAVVAGAGGALAVVRRRGINRLPLELAPVAAVDERAHSVAFRAWLGRGRRIDVLTVDVSWRALDGAVVPLSPWVPAAPVVGRFQAVVRDLPAGWDLGWLDVTVEARSRGEVWRMTRSYGPGERRTGTFAPGLRRSGGGLAWVQQEWPHVEAPSDGPPGRTP